MARAGLQIRKYLGIAWGQDADTQKSAFQTYYWTDMSHMLRDVGSPAVSTRRGRQETTQRVMTGAGMFLLDNRYQMFESLNPASPYAGLLGPMVPVRYALEYPWLPGQVPDPLFRSDVTATWAGTNCSIGWITPPNDLDPGWLQMTCAVSATAMSAQSPPILVPAAKVGMPVQASGRFHSTSGPTNATVAVEVSFYSDTAGTSLISTVAGANLTIAHGQGDVRAALSTVVPAATVTMRFRYKVQATGLTAGNIFLGRHPVLEYADTQAFQIHYQGYSDSWVCSQPDGLGDMLCTLSCSDLFKSMGLTPMRSPLYGDYLRTITRGMHWYRLGETAPNADAVTAQAMRVKDEIDGQPHGFPPPSGATLDFGLPATVDNINPGVAGRGPLYGVAGCSPLDTDFAWSNVGPSSTDGGMLAFDNMRPIVPFTINLWIRSTNGVPYDIDQGGSHLPGSPSVDIPILTGLWQNPHYFSTGHEHYQQMFLNVLQIGADNPNEGCLKWELGFQNIDISTGIPIIVVSYGIGFNTSSFKWFADSQWHMFTFTYTNQSSVNHGRMYIDGFYDSSNPGRTDDPSFPRGGFDDSYWNISTDDGRGQDQSTIGGGLRLGYVQNYPSPDISPGLYEFDELIMFDSVKSDAIISDMYVKAKVAYPQQPVGARGAAVADLVGIPSTLRDINIAKGRPVAWVTAPFDKQNPVQYFQQLDDVDQGLTFISKDGKLTQLYHQDMINGTSVYQTPAFVFGNAGGAEIPFTMAPTQNDDTTFYTQATVSRLGGQTKVVKNITGKYVRDLALANVPVVDDDDAEDLAAYLAAVYGVTGTRITQLTVQAESCIEALQAVNTIEIGHMIAVRTRVGAYAKGTAVPGGGGGTFGSGTFGSGSFGSPAGGSNAPKVYSYWNYGGGGTSATVARMVAAGWNIVTNSSVLPTVADLLAAGIDIFVLNGAQFAVTGTELTRAYDAYNAGIHVLTEGNDTDPAGAGNPIWTGDVDTGGPFLLEPTQPTGTQSLAGFTPFNEDDNRRYLTGIRSTAHVWAQARHNTDGVMQPVGIWEENPNMNGARYIHSQQQDAACSTDYIDRMLRWLWEGSQPYYQFMAQVQGISHDGSRGPSTVVYDLSSIFAQHWMQFSDNFGTYNMAL